MKRLLFILLFATSSVTAKAPAERWLDPTCFGVNRAPMRTSFIVYPTAGEASPENTPERSPFYRSLNGVWTFLRVDRPGAEPDGFFRPGIDDSSWGEMPVPGLWEMNGYGDPVYTNKPYPWYRFFPVTAPLVPSGTVRKPEQPNLTDGTRLTQSNTERPEPAGSGLSAQTALLGQSAS